MNPFLHAALTRYNSARDDTTEIQNRAKTEERDLTKEEVATIEGHVAAMNQMGPLIEQFAHEEKRTRAVADAAAAIDAGNRGELVDELVPALVPGRTQLSEMLRSIDEQRTHRWSVQPERRGVSLAGGDAEHRALVTTSTTGAPVAAGGGTPLREPRRIATAAGLPVQRVSGVEGVTWPVFGSADAADIVAEGATKPEYDNITSATATPQMIAMWTDFTRQVGMTLPNFERRLQAKLSARVARREDVLMVARVLATTGIQTYAAGADQPFADSLLQAAALVLASDVAAAPNLAVVHPTDVVAIFGGSATGTAGETPQSELRLDLHGMTVYPSTAVTAGTAIVGAWPAAAELIVGLPPTVFVDAVSGLKTNKITVLLEEAVTLGVTEPEGFVSVDFVPA
ncbi:phage major capsid family protein [Pseudonocardia hydrocarbonoxydans]|uniref:Phage capsid-like C-terminal domain-containing protein n=1 Tax=Pseudonocardia hydrocarbonoxydans TaxID=76726 RepID=A0A4Y3WPJ5_9PSEU|nr:phage major capsid protein [Pseudonocardia hydrocarbonoxydans]GEC20812.1 hypothetical protein PHY01_30950 [Pseudonocardia hydrocarbonoxydans]